MEEHVFCKLDKVYPHMVKKKKTRPSEESSDSDQEFERDSVKPEKKYNKNIPSPYQYVPVYPYSYNPPIFKDQNNIDFERKINQLEKELEYLKNEKQGSVIHETTTQGLLAANRGRYIVAPNNSRGLLTAFFDEPSNTQLIQILVIISIVVLILLAIAIIFWMVVAGIRASKKPVV